MIRTVCLMGIMALACVTEGPVRAAFGLDSMTFGSALVSTLFLGLRRPPEAGAWGLLGLLPLAQWCAGGPSGVYALGLVVCFFVIHLFGPKIAPQWSPLTTPLLCAALALGHQGTSVLFWLATRPEPDLMMATLHTTPW